MVLRLVLFVLLLIAVPQGWATGTARVDVLVIAPHPDDEVLMAAAAMERALEQHRRVAVVLVTNGDFTCDRSGWVRQAESIAALEALGVSEDDVHFLGYPDGALSELGEQPLGPRGRTEPDGDCAQASGTYANRGAGRIDEHSRRTGHPGPWTAEGLTEDLVSLLDRLRPTDVYVSHGIDAHPDHAATYVYFRRALDRLAVGPALVHRSVIHAAGCWPGSCSAPYAPLAAMPPLPAPHEAYLASERLPTDARKKLGLLALYPSQIGSTPSTDWLSSFARREEIYFPERLVRHDGRWRRAPLREPFEVPLGRETSVVVNASLAFELEVAAGHVTLRRDSPAGPVALASWRVSEPGPFVLRVEPRPDDGDVAEWSVWGPRGLVGLQVLSPLVTRVDLGPTLPPPPLPPSPRR